MSRAIAVCLTFVCLLPYSGSRLRAEDALADINLVRPVAETATADAAGFDTNSVTWTPSPRPDRNKRYWKGVWIATWAAFVAVNILDTHSSAGRREANPLLRDSNGVFNGRKAVVVKSAAGGGFFALQAWLARRNPGENHYKTFAIATGAVTAGLGAVAVRNYGVAPVAGPQAAPFVPDYVLRER
jgi:hypothetical protein